MPSNISLKELQDVIQKSGLPLGSGADMSSIAPFARSNISDTVYGQDTQLAGIKSKHQSALSQIAAMDQKLGGLYGDPSSPLYIKNPLKRETLKTGAANTGYRAAAGIVTEAKSRTQELESQTDEALRLYKDLAQEQVKLEKEAAKQAKKSGKTTKSTKTVKGASTNGKTTTTGKIKLTKDQQLAGFSDADAANYWTKIKETDFKRTWVQNMLEGGAVPDGGFTIQDVKTNYKSWQKANPPKTKKTTTSKTTKREPLF